MKLEHFIMTLNHNNIHTEVHNVNEGVSGVLKVNDNISIVYYQGEEVVQSVQLLYAAVGSYKPDEQLEHITSILNITDVLTRTLCNLEGRVVMNQLGMFNQESFKPKEISYLDNMFKVDTVDGIVFLTIATENEV